MVAALELMEVERHFGALAAVDRVSLALSPGEMLALLGPSGCGKTTTLRIVAGFERPDSGRVVIHGEDVTAAPPYQRDTGMVFQQYALFPHMTVWQNVAFGLRMRGAPKSDWPIRVGDALALVSLAGLEERYPSQLSGGQQQRVALARALVIRPQLLLLDEPLSSLDAKLRQEMRLELRRIQKRVGITALFVTHDQEEALSLADRLAVMNQGRIEQLGTPMEIYERPRTRFVAGFIGQSNFFAGQIVDSGGDRAEASLRTEDGILLRAHNSLRLAVGTAAVLAVKDQRLRLHLDATAAGAAAISATVESVAYLGTAIQYACRSNGRVVMALVGNDGHGVSISPETKIWIEWSPTDAVLLPEV
jgi:spermidine/putrescine transport system ATP-binding protein